MPIKNYKKLVEVIKADCKTRQIYYNVLTGETCAIGAIAQSAGFDVKAYFTNPLTKSRNVDLISNYNLVQMSDWIEREYELSVSEQRMIQSLNDAWASSLLRRHYIIKLLADIHASEIRPYISKTIEKVFS